MYGYLLKGLIVSLVVRHDGLDPWDDFWIEKRREWKEKEKVRSEDSWWRKILPKSLSISDSYPIWANAHALSLSSSMNTRWTVGTVGTVGSLLS